MRHSAPVTLLIGMLVAALTTGCSQSKAPPPPLVGRAETPVQAPAESKESKESLNDKAFAAIQAKNWTEAIRLAVQAVALDPNFAAARFNLGLALYRSGQYTQAEAQLAAAYKLNQQQAEPGWYLALTLEQLGKTTEAVTVLKDLRARYPADADVKAALVRFGAEAVVWKVPSGARSYTVLGDDMVRVTADRMGLEARDLSDKPVWTVALGEPVQYLLGRPDGKYLLAVTDKSYVLIDPATGANLGKAPFGAVETPGGKWRQIFWRGTYLYIAQDNWGMLSNGSPRYMSTVWTGYRMMESGGSVTWERFTQDGMGGSQSLSASDDGRTAVVVGLSGSSELYREGKRLRELPGRLTLVPDGTGLFSANAETVQFFDLEGKLVWNRNLPKDFHASGPWQGGVVATHWAGGWVVLKGKEQTGPEGNTKLLAITARHLVVQGASGGIDLIDASGNITVHLAETGAPLISDDGRWLTINQDDEIRAYRLP